MNAGRCPVSFVSLSTLKQDTMTTRISYAIALLLGLGMIFLGARFFISPDVATVGYGIHVNAKAIIHFIILKESEIYFLVL